MENKKQNNLRIHQRNGRDQLSRDEAYLNPVNIKLHDFDVEKWMEFAYLFAEKVNYFSDEDANTASGNWQDFFIKKDSIQDFLAEIETENTGELTPHLTLFICFLKLLEPSKARLNGLTKRHLDFYYKEVLQIENLPEAEDQAFVIFNLAKSISNYLVEEDLALNGGKDADGKVLNYLVKEELAATKTKVAQIKNVYNEANLFKEDGTEVESRYAIKAAAIANSIDGLGGALSAEDPTWYPFGYYSHKKTSDSDNAIEELPDAVPLPDAKVGFAVSSPVLLLAEGTRVVTIDLGFSDALADDLDTWEFGDHVQVYITGKKAWLGPFSVTYTSEGITNSQKISLSFSLSADDESVLNYNAAIHGEQFDTTDPVARVLFNPNTQEGYLIYKELAETNKLETVNITVDVTGVKTIEMEGDNGTLNPLKPFYPFTTRPVKGSSFSFYNEEAFSKNWSKIDFQLTWKNTPADFPAHYAAYDQTFLGNISLTNYEETLSQVNWKENSDIIVKKLKDTGFLRNVAARVDSDKKGTSVSQRSSLSDTNEAESTVSYNALVKSNGYFTADAAIYAQEVWRPFLNPTRVLFTEDAVTGGFGLDYRFSRLGDLTKTGPIRLKLNRSFLHELFPRLYALSLTSKLPNIPVPNEPYTPFAEEPSLNYVATDTANVNENSAAQFENRTTRFFHEQPFGQSEVHAYLKSTYLDTTTNCYALPTFCKGGELFIGLENAQVSELVTLLIQVAEGTENPLVDSFSGTQKVKWDILCNNVWREMESSLMTANEIDNFLRSGRIQFTIPSYANSDNTLLPNGLFWIRAKMYKHYDAVCKVYGIHTQAALVQFQNQGNNLAHLENGLPANSISKLVERLSQIKSLEQPYATFGGKPEETDLLYYRRVSERLRHKNRAISLWDYEHLVLQEFPDVYKVKCLNHALNLDFIAPGNVCLVVIPDSINKQVFDVFQPRVSRAKLNEIQAYISQLNSMHVQLEVVNPDYEEVKIEIKAKFYKGLDENTYKAKLNEDLIRYLSPWAFSDSREITFGAVFYRSGLIHFIEKLDYVDFIREIKIYKENELMSTNCSPSTPRSILVSAKAHTVEIATDCSKEITLENTETCQL